MIIERIDLLGIVTEQIEIPSEQYFARFIIEYNGHRYFLSPNEMYEIQHPVYPIEEKKSFKFGN